MARNTQLLSTGTNCHTVVICVTLHVVSVILVASQDSFPPLPSADRFGPEHRLLEELLRGYHNKARPVYDPLQAVNVSMSGISLMQLEALDEKNQVLRLFALISFSWTDEYLVWNPDDYGGIQQVVLDPRSVWKPNIIMSNSADDVYGDLTNADFDVLVSCNGSAVRFTSGRMSINCPLVLTRFPFDVHTCTLKLESWTYHGNEQSLWSPISTVDMSSYLDDGQWDISQTSVTSRAVIFHKLATPYYSLHISLTLKRKPLFYMLNVLLPCMILSLLVVTVFRMPADAGEKISLGITVLLSFTVFQLLVADVMPATSESTPAISVYLVSVMTLSALSILCTLTVLGLHHFDSPRRPPAWMRRLVFDFLSRLLLMPKNVYGNDQCGKRGDDPPSCDPALSCDIAATKSSQSPSVSLRFAGEKQEHGLNEKVKQQRADVEGWQSLETSVQNVSVQLLLEIRQELGKLTNELETKQTAMRVKDEWVKMAQILDRLFFFLFLLATVLVGTIMMGIVTS